MSVNNKGFEEYSKKLIALVVAQVFIVTSFIYPSPLYSLNQSAKSRLIPGLQSNGTGRRSNAARSEQLETKSGKALIALAINDVIEQVGTVKEDELAERIATAISNALEGIPEKSPLKGNVSLISCMAIDGTIWIEYKVNKTTRVLAYDPNRPVKDGLRDSSKEALNRAIQENLNAQKALKVKAATQYLNAFLGRAEDAPFNQETLAQLAAKFGKLPEETKYEFSRHLLEILYTDVIRTKREKVALTSPRFVSIDGSIVVDIGIVLGSTPDGTLVIQDVIVNPANSGPKAAIIAASFGLKTRFYGFGSGIERDIFAYLIERQHQAGEVDLLEGACRTKVYLFVPNISDPNQPPRQIPLQTPRQPLNEETGEQLIEYLEEHLPKASQGNEFALFPGQILHNAPVEVILRLIKLAKGKGYKTVVNYRPGLGLPEMKAALSASPTVLQTNLDELIQIGGVEPSVFIRNGRPNINEITNKAAALAKENNIQTMIVTLGRYGAIAVDRETGGIYKALYVRAAKIKQKGDVGIGDALLGGFLVKMSEGSDIREALIYGVASGTATAAKPGIEIETDPEAIQGMVRRMQRQWGERLVTDIDVSSVNVSVALLVKDIDKILLNIAEDRSMEALQYITNPSIQQWVQERAKFLEAGGIEVIKATDEKRILEQAVREGVLIKLADGSYYHRSHLKDTARAEFPTHIATDDPADAGRFNNWMPEEDARQQLEEKTRGSYNGKKMYVVPFIMFPGSPIERIGFQITDSLYGVANLLQLTRVGDVVVGDEALRKLNTTDPKNILRMWHATGDLDTIKRATEPGKPEDRLFVAFPKSKEVGLFGSAYGGNLLGPKKFGLRLLQYIAYQNVKEAREEGRPIPPNTLVLMEHAALIEFINKKTNDTYRIMLFGPSQSGKSTFATYLPPGELADDWEVQTISDDLVGMWFDEEGYLVGANPEAGLFAVAPKTGRRTNPRLVEATLGPEIKPRNKPVIFTNLALHIDGRVWWEELSDEVPIDSAELEQYRRWVKGETDEAPKSLEGWLDWTGEPIAKRQKDRRKDPWAHPNARFTVNRVNLPSGSPNWHIGGRIDAILFGGRNPDGQPPLVQLATLERAILDGLFMAPQETAAVEGAKIGRRRSDPFALRPFYATTEQQHLETWLYVMNQAQRKGRLPAFFHFDQFRKGWPGFRQDVRLIWLALAMAGKFEGVQVEAVDTPLGRIPTPESVRPFLEGLGIPPETIIDMFSYHSDYGAEEASRWAAFLEELGKGGFQLPPELQTTYEELIRVSKEITDAAEQLAGRAKGGLSNYPLTLKAEAPELWDKVVKHKIIIRSPVDGAIYVWNSDQLIAVMRDFYAQGHFDEAMDSIITIDENGPVGVLGFIEKALRFIFGFNFRSDRQRQWIQAVLDRLFNKFNNSDVFGMSLITMARHLELIKEGEFILPDIVIKNGLVEWLGRQDINVGWGFSREKNQFISTFRGGEKPFDNEDISYGNISMPRVVTTARMKTTEGEKQVNVYNQVRNKDYWRYPGLSMRWVALADRRMLLESAKQEGKFWVVSNLDACDLNCHEATQHLNEEADLWIEDEKFEDIVFSGEEFGQKLERLKTLGIKELQRGEDGYDVEVDILKEAEEAKRVEVFVGGLEMINALGLKDQFKGNEQAFLEVNFVTNEITVAKLVAKRGNGWDSGYATVQALDRAVKIVLDTLAEVNGIAVIAPDHGSLDDMRQPGHTGADVPLIAVDYRDGKRRVVPLERQCSQADAAVTLLHMTGITPPEDMTGKNAIPDSADYEVKPGRPTIFLITDGYGLGDPDDTSNVIAQARKKGLTPTLTELLEGGYAVMPSAGDKAGLRGGRQREFDGSELLTKEGVIEKIAADLSIETIELVNYDYNNKPFGTFNREKGLYELRKNPFLNDRQFVLQVEGRRAKVLFFDPVQFGSTEFNLWTLGAGRIVTQKVVLADDGFEDGSLFKTSAMGRAVNLAKQLGFMPLTGIYQEGIIGVHASMRHIYYLIQYFKKQGVNKFVFFGASDGRDEDKTDGIKRIEELRRAMNYFGLKEGENYIIHNAGGSWHLVRMFLNILMYGSRTVPAYLPKPPVETKPNQGLARLDQAIAQLERITESVTNETFVSAVRQLAEAITDAAKNLARVPVKLPRDLVAEIVSQKISAGKILEGISDTEITDGRLRLARQTLLELIALAEAGDYLTLQERIGLFNKDFKYLGPKLEHSQREIFNRMMLAESVLARDVAMHYLEKGNAQTLEILTQNALAEVEEFIEAKIAAGSFKPSERNKIETVKKFLVQWLGEPNIPQYIKQGIVRGMLEGRSDDLIYAFGNGWRMFGTAGIRNQAVNSSFDAVQLLELEEFAQDPHAPILEGPNLINAVTLLQQTATVKHIIAALRAYLVENTEATEVSLRDLMSYSELFKRTQSARQIDIEDIPPDVVIALPEDIKESIRNNSITISFDSRLNGRYWAHMLAADLLEAGIKVNLFENVSGMPSETIAAGRYVSVFGFLISASHSEPNYNGFKFVIGPLKSQVDPNFQKTIMAFRGMIQYDDIALSMASPETDPATYLMKNNTRLTWLGKSKPPKGHQDYGAARRDFYTPTYAELRKRSPLAALEASNPDLANRFEEERAKLRVLYTAFSGAGADDAEDLMGFFRAMGYSSIEEVLAQTSHVDGRFPAFIQGWKTGMPDPGSTEACAANLADYLIQIAGDDLSHLSEAVDRVNQLDMLGATDPDSDRAGEGVSLDAERYPGATGNMKTLIIASMEKALSERGYAPEIIKGVKALLVARLDDKLHLTANDAWTFIVYWKLRLLEEQGLLEKNRLYVVIKSHVTTSALEGVAKYYRSKGYNVYVVDTYVGFTLLAERADALFNFAKVAWEAVSCGSDDATIAKLKETMPQLERVYTPLAGQIEAVDELMVLLRDFIREGPGRVDIEQVRAYLLETLGTQVADEVGAMEALREKIYAASNTAQELMHAVSLFKREALPALMTDFADKVGAIPVDFRGEFEQVFEAARVFMNKLEIVPAGSKLDAKLDEERVALSHELSRVANKGRVASLYSGKGMEGAKQEVLSFARRAIKEYIEDFNMAIPGTIVLGAYDGKGKLIGVLKGQVIKRQINKDGPEEEVFQADFLAVEPGLTAAQGFGIENNLITQLYFKLYEYKIKELEKSRQHKVESLKPGEYIPILEHSLKVSEGSKSAFNEYLLVWNYWPRRPIPNIKDEFITEDRQGHKIVLVHDRLSGRQDENHGLRQRTPEEIRAAVGMISYLDIAAGVEESNGYGEFGRTALERGRALTIVDEHIREKDGGLALYEFMELMVYLRTMGKSFHDAYLEMMRDSGNATATSNNYNRHVGAAGEAEKVGTIQSIEKELAFSVMRALDHGQKVSFFNGGYVFDPEKPAVEIFWDKKYKKYDNYYRRFPEEGVRFNLVTEYQGTTYKITVTYRPSGTGMENRVYSWAIGVVPKDNSLGQVESIRRNVEIVKQQLVRDFFGDEGFRTGYFDRPEFGGILLAMNEGGFNRFREVFARALGIDEVKFSEWEERLLQNTMDFAFAARQLKEATPAERAAHKEKLSFASKANFKLWDEYLASAEAIAYPVKVKFKINGEVLTEIPRSMAICFSASLADYIAGLIEARYGKEEPAEIDCEIADLVGLVMQFSPAPLKQVAVGKSKLPEASVLTGSAANLILDLCLDGVIKEALKDESWWTIDKLIEAVGKSQAPRKETSVRKEVKALLGLGLLHVDKSQRAYKYQIDYRLMGISSKVAEEVANIRNAALNVSDVPDTVVADLKPEIGEILAKENERLAREADISFRYTYNQARDMISGTHVKIVLPIEVLEGFISLKTYLQNLREEAGKAGGKVEFIFDATKIKDKEGFLELVALEEKGEGYEIVFNEERLGAIQRGLRQDLQAGGIKLGVAGTNSYLEENWREGDYEGIGRLRLREVKELGNNEANLRVIPDIYGVILGFQVNVQKVTGTKNTYESTPTRVSRAYSEQLAGWKAQLRAK